MRPNTDLLQRAVVLAVTVILALGHTALDAAIGITVHFPSSFSPMSLLVYPRERKLWQEVFDRRQKIAYTISSRSA